jgi:hypothetical protein
LKALSSGSRPKDFRESARVDQRCQLPLIFTSFICGNVVIALSKRVGSVINPDRANPFRIGRTDRGTFGVMQKLMVHRRFRSHATHH